MKRGVLVKIEKLSDTDKPGCYAAYENALNQIARKIAIAHSIWRKFTHYLAKIHTKTV